MPDLTLSDLDRLEMTLYGGGVSRADLDALMATARHAADLRTRLAACEADQAKAAAMVGMAQAKDATPVVLASMVNEAMKTR